MIALGVLLAVVGVGLWVYAGLLPVARILRGGDQRVVVLQIRTTWMGTLTLSIRQVSNVRGARVAPSTARLHSKVELQADGAWHAVDIKFTKDTTAVKQFVVVLRQYLKSGGPRVLALPLRGRVEMMKRFLLFFPLGTASIFTAMLLITQ